MGDRLALEGLPVELAPYVRGRRALLANRMLPVVRAAVVPMLAPNIIESDRLAAITALADVFATELLRAALHGASPADAGCRGRAILGALCDRLIEQFGAYGIVLAQREAAQLEPAA